MTAVFVGDIGTEIVLDCGTNVSAATVRSIVARKASGVKVTWTAQADGLNSVKYVTTSGDLDVAGVWKLQAYIEMPGWKGYGEITPLTVKTPL